MAAAALPRSVANWVNPAVFDFWAAHVNPLWTWQRPLAKVVARYPESSDAVTLVLQANRHFQGFKPGQHINVSAEVNGHRVTRSYSLTGLPDQNKELRITVKEVEGGRLSAHLCRHTRVGDVLEIGQAFGELNASTDGQPLYLLAAGSGITPMMSLLRARDLQAERSPAMLLYWAGRREALCFVEELRARAADPAQKLQLIFILTQQEPERNDERQGRISAELLQPLFQQEKVHIRCCGPAEFVSSAREMTRDHVLTFQAEAFTPPLTNSVSDKGNVEVFLSRSQRHLQIPKGESLLDALESQGLQVEYGCRMGICNTCACGKQEGSTQNMQTGEQSHEATSALRLCINRATTNLTLDL